MKTLKNQLWLVPEPVEGILTAPTVADAIYASKLEAEPDYAEIDLSRVANSQDTEPTLVARKVWKLTFGVDFKGSGASGGVPRLPAELDKLLRISGRRVHQLYKMTGAAITGTIAHGETFTQATSGATGVIVGSYSGTPGRIIYRATSGTVTAGANLITCSGGATFTPGAGAVVAWGTAYSPVSTEWSTALRGAWTGTPIVGETLTTPANAVATLLDASPPLGSAGQLSVKVELGSVAPTTTTLLTAGVTAGAAVVIPVTAGTGTNFAVGSKAVVGFGTAAAEEVTISANSANSITATIANNHNSGDTVAASLVLTGATSGATCVLFGSLLASHNCSASAAWLLDGQAVYLTGCRANMRLAWVTSEPLRADMTLQGFEYQVVNQLLGSATYDTTPPPRFVSANWTLDGRPFFISKFDFDFGNSLGIQPDANATEGGIAYRIGKRDPALTVDPNAVTPAGYNFLGKAAASTLVGAKVRIGAKENELGSYSNIGYVVWVDVPQVQFRAPKLVDRDGDVAVDLSGKARRGSAAGDDSSWFYFL